jgi:hypothetical protein
MVNVFVLYYNYHVEIAQHGSYLITVNYCKLEEDCLAGSSASRLSRNMVKKSS